MGLLETEVDGCWDSLPNTLCSLRHGSTWLPLRFTVNKWRILLSLLKPFPRWCTAFSGLFSQNAQDEISMAHRSIYTNPEKVFPYCPGDEDQGSHLWPLMKSPSYKYNISFSPHFCCSPAFVFILPAWISSWK